MNLSANHYTVHHDPVIDRFVQNHLDIIVAELRALLAEKLDAVLLAGGFGRGEGGVAQTGNSFRIINDYDLTILLKAPFVLNYRRYAGPLHQMAKRLAYRLGIKQIDFSVKNRSMLERDKPSTVAQYELLSGHRVLHGLPLEIAHLLKIEEPLPLIEGAVYFLNRGSGLLIAARYLRPDGSVSAEDQENFIIECDKAIIAIGDAILIMQNLYHYSYLVRLQRIRESESGEFLGCDAVKPLYTQAVQRKLNSASSPPAITDFSEWWFEIRQLFERYFHQYEQKRLQREFIDWLEYSSIIYKAWGVSATRIFQKILHVSPTAALFRPRTWREIRFSQARALISIMPLLLFARSQEGLKQTYLDRAARIYRDPVSGHDEQRWTHLVNRYLLYYHPAGAAEEIATRNH